MTIRPAVAGDSEGIARVHFEAVRGTASASYPPEVIESWGRPPDDSRRELFRATIAGGEELVVVAETDGAVVGFGSIVPALQELRAVYVDPRAGRRGVGGHIVAELERLARARRLPELHLVASLNAEAFYTRHGYEVVERGIHRQSSGTEMACVKMKKSLVPIGGSAPGAAPEGGRRG